MSARRELRQKVFITVLDFLDEHYDCDCPRADPDGSNTAEAGNLTALILSAAYGEDARKPEPSAEDIDTNALRRYLNNRRLAAKVYDESAKRLGRGVPESIQTYLKEEDNP